MKIINLSLVCLATFTFAGCFGDESADNDLPPVQEASQTAALGEADLPTEIYYSAERDYRKCMAPMCGGYWLKAVNLDETVCADGTIGGEDGCYVAGLDLHGIELQGEDLLHGEFRKVNYGTIVADHLDVDAAFTPALANAQPYPWINLIQDTGIRCITTPCPSQRIAMVNTDYAWTNYGFKYGVTGADRAILEDAFLNAYSTGGALVQSHWHHHGWHWELSVTNVYKRNEAASAGPFCTFMKREGEDAYVAWNVHTYEDGKNLLAGGGFEQGTEGIVEGTCEAYAIMCTTEYAPVCGTIDATGETKTYSNQCYLEAGVRAAAGTDGKATGTWTQGECVAQGAVGDPCGARLGEICQDGLFCKFAIEYACGAFDMTGICSELSDACAQVYEPVCGCDGRDYSNECAAWQHGMSASHAGTCN